MFAKNKQKKGDGVFKKQVLKDKIYYFYIIFKNFFIFLYYFFLKFTIRSSSNKSGNIEDSQNSFNFTFRFIDFAQLVESFVRNGDLSQIRFYGTERIVGGFCDNLFGK